MIYRALALSLVVLSTPLGAQTLSERIARGDMPPTARQMALRDSECALPEEDLQTIEFNGQIGARVTFPSTRVLPLGYVMLDADNTASIAQFGPLPYGGVGQQDVCAPVTLIPLAGGMSAPLADAVQIFGLALRSGLDLAQDYPSSFEVMEQDARMISLAGGSWILLGTSDATVSEMMQDLAASPDVDQATPAIRMGDLLLVRMVN